MNCFLIPAGIFISDTLLKRKIDKSYPLGERKFIFGKKIILEKYYNKGAALNFLSSSPKIMTALHTLIVSGIAVCYAALFRTKGNGGLKIGAGMILGGGMSNLFDRYTKGHVIDYFRFNVPFRALKNIIFNLSDIWIFSGSLLFVYFFERKS